MGTAATSGSSAAGASGASAAGAAGSNTPPAAARPPAVGLKLPTMMESPMVAPWFNITRPTDLSATNQPLPVIAWANGGCFRSDFTWQPLFDVWAAGGFVVLALTESPSDGPLGTTTADDQEALVDWAIAENEKAGGSYAGKLDIKRIVAVGNSCGGVTALTLASMDPRIAAVFVLSGSSALGDTDKSIMGKIKVPVGYVTGAPGEDIANGPANSDYDALPEGIPAMIVNRSSGDHLTVSTDEKVLPQDAQIGLNWMDLAVFGTHEAFDTLSSPTVCTGCDMGVWTLKSKNMDKLKH